MCSPEEGHGVVPILGTMTFGAGGQVKPDMVGTLLRSFIGAGCTRTPHGALIDTARIYQMATPEGDTETTLGQVFEMFPSLQKGSCIATKAHNKVPPHFSLSRQSVIEQCNASCERLDCDCIDLFYLHSPDINTNINDTLDGIDELHRAGKIREFGLSNYPAWAVVDIWYRCKQRGMVLPTVCQVKYNVLNRDMEKELVPVAREFGLRLYVYNPLAGGVLSGRYNCLEDVLNAKEGRFSEEFDDAFGKGLKAGTVNYRNRYGKQGVLDGVSLIRKACLPEGYKSTEEQPKVVEDKTSVVDGMRVRLIVSESATAQPSGLDMANVALRWLIHHSCLTRGDGIIFGVSKNSHLAGNLAAWQSGPLDDDVLAACEAAWDLARSAAESYFNGYGPTPGSINTFLELKHAQRKDGKSVEDEPPQKASKT
mmetsp:Transcript_115741/g.180873  ORF Transcript_115741/g.180873 Transcript_115741/m.180873 type:complete len:424 (+) Transcript_115741:56-1327(+)